MLRKPIRAESKKKQLCRYNDIYVVITTYYVVITTYDRCRYNEISRYNNILSRYNNIRRMSPREDPGISREYLLRTPSVS